MTAGGSDVEILEGPRLPFPVDGHCMAKDPESGRVFSLGGQTGDGAATSIRQAINEQKRK